MPLNLQSPLKSKRHINSFVNSVYVFADIPVRTERKCHFLMPFLSWKLELATMGNHYFSQQTWNCHTEPVSSHFSLLDQNVTQVLQIGKVLFKCLHSICKGG